MTLGRVRVAVGLGVAVGSGSGVRLRRLRGPTGDRARTEDWARRVPVRVRSRTEHHCVRSKSRNSSSDETECRSHPTDARAAIEHRDARRWSGRVPVRSSESIERPASRASTCYRIPNPVRPSPSVSSAVYGRVYPVDSRPLETSRDHTYSTELSTVGIPIIPEISGESFRPAGAAAGLRFILTTRHRRGAQIATPWQPHAHVNSHVHVPHTCDVWRTEATDRGETYAGLTPDTAPAGACSSLSTVYSAILKRNSVAAPPPRAEFHAQCGPQPHDSHADGRSCEVRTSIRVLTSFVTDSAASRPVSVPELALGWQGNWAEHYPTTVPSPSRR